jgi:aspartyl-tRNA(Asn)/glutamyl-tRNA(Gln) amidotransferase subunit A
MVLDLMGESRLAASRANVCGFKPGYGLVSRYGIIGLIPSMEACGILSESIGTIRAILETVAGPDERDFSLPDEKLPDFSKQDIEPRKITLGYIKEVLDTLTPGRKQSFDTSIEKMKSAGFSVKEVALPDFSLFSLVHKIVGSVEASSAAGRYDSVRYGQRVPGTKNWNDMYLKSREAAFGTLLKSYLFQGAYFQFERYKDFENACRIRTRLLNDMTRIGNETDFLVFPMADTSQKEEPVLPDDIYPQFAGTLFSNVSGWPALVIPSGSGNSMQLAGPRLSDG